MGAYDTHTEKCPYCGCECEADWVDVGIGLVQCGPFHCENCYASEIGPHDEERELSKEEQYTGWYLPHSEPSSSANTIDGKIVSHKVALKEYKNPSLKKLQEEMAKELFGTTKEKANYSGLCIQCKQPALKNCYSEAGRKEFRISGFCEKCFDKIFK